MTWHYELVCDGCSFKRKNVNMQTHLEANEHEQGTVDHWVQLVQVSDDSEATSRRKAK